MSTFRLIISGGGTGGHIFPAIAIANAVMELEPNAEVLFVGATGKMEMEKVPESGYKIVGLPIRGIQRKLSLANLKVPFLLIQSLLKSYRTIKKFNPDVVVGVGGYASAAVVYTASLMGNKTLIQEQNSYPGITNKILSKRVDIICTAFDGMHAFFPINKIKLLGNPIRQDIISNGNNKSKGCDHFKLDQNKTTLLAIGGSLGARTINESVEQLIPLTKSHNIQIVWQCGKSGFERLSTNNAIHSNENIKLFQFIKEMDLAYASSDLIVSRAGALSISEISLLKKTAILIPSPNVAEDHQTKNAKALTESHAAILLKDDVAKNQLVQVIKNLLENPTEKERIKKNLTKVFSNATAANDIAREIINLRRQ